ncbi:helix-turn-helix domain-containing protein [Seonamhaeicola sp. MEBiC1930]|uniref:helix-turn-helix domain-containing protein n=1 Tax=Seonamhaeicola sp. MEBiC01930 TaxID=2976768 RepID=UPI003253C3CF
MRDLSKIIISLLMLLYISYSYAIIYNSSKYHSTLQIDSVIQQQNIERVKTLESALNYYEEGIKLKHSDSLNLLKNLALAHAELNNPKEAANFTEKYIEQSSDISVLNNTVFENVKASPEFSKLNGKYSLKITYLSLFYIFTSFIGLFIAIVINFRKSENRYSNFLIGLFVFLHSLFIINSTLYITNYMYKVPHSLFITVSFSYLYGPLLYFYFKSITKNLVFRMSDLLHLLPTIAMIIYAIPVYFLSGNDKLRFMINNNTESPGFFVVFLVFTKFLSLAIYTFAIHRIYVNNKNENIGYSPIDLKWQYILKNISIAYVVTYLLYGYAGLFYPYITAARHPQVLIMSLSILSIAFVAYINPELFSSKTQNIINSSLGFKKYKKSGLTQNLSIELKENLIQLFNEEKLYKNSSINLDTIASKLETTRHSASQVINEHFNMNFSELINKFRVKEAINILEEDIHGSLNIIDVAYEVGYNNKVTFNKAFKKETSLTPSEFINLRIKKRSYA